MLAIPSMEIPIIKKKIKQKLGFERIKPIVLMNEAPMIDGEANERINARRKEADSEL